MAGIRVSKSWWLVVLQGARELGLVVKAFTNESPGLLI
jgi:hypothetical protein